MSRRDVRGFTLIEVIIALLVVALGIGALLTTLTQSARLLGDLRDQSFAQWIALNRLSEVRLDTGRPSVGITSGTLEYAGLEWRWEQEVSDPGVAGMLRIDVHVALATTADSPARAGTSTSASGESGESADGLSGPSFAALATAYGFVGTRVARPSGIDPDWSFEAARLPGDGGRGPGPGPGADPDPAPDGGEPLPP